MELKQVTEHTFNVAMTVLIVPLWNWNVKLDSEIIPPEGLNRTFMELKLKSKPTATAETLVLIVPLWNWNRGGVVLLEVVAES